MNIWRKFLKIFLHKIHSATFSSYFVYDFIKPISFKVSNVANGPFVKVKTKFYEKNQLAIFWLVFILFNVQNKMGFFMTIFILQRRRQH